MSTHATSAQEPVSIPRDAQAKRAFWREEVKRFQASGQSQVVYSRERGLPATQLSYWWLKFHPVKKQASTVSSSPFLPVKVTGQPTGTMIRIKRPNGVVIELPLSTDIAALKSLLALLLC